ncbi:MAG: hypothetical protein KME15_02965 [Drouetiella hepatica Uher 2000/2452]|uniref:Cell division protein FtsL n=1 Tax=Drouetiella hepatica Uher 2000/2452 TaxID=904376 RepID=A0A951Q834_9CYAN|nr:hypothetical protein [Drouetiella hepatica Uher 2000/2452]
MASAMRSNPGSADRRPPAPRSIFSGSTQRSSSRRSGAGRSVARPRPENVSAVKSARNSVVQQLPRPQTAPPWVKMLLNVQRTSSLVTFSLIIGLLAVYGWTVYTQQRWGRAYTHLESLQKQERQMTAASEVLKNQMAKQAEAPDVGLALPDPGNTVFLTPAPQRAAVEPEVNLPPPQPIPARPLGY